MSVYSFFSVPIGDYHMPEEDAVPLCKELKRLFIEKESLGSEYKNKTYRETQKGSVFESTFDIYNWDSPAIDAMSDFIKVSLKDFLNRITTLTSEQIESMNFNFHPWYHITRFEGRQGIHNHSNASWSGIYCIDPGEFPEEYPDSGKVYFHDPRVNANIYEDDGLAHLKEPFTHGVIPIQHEAGRLLFFPSYLLHEIFPYFGNRERIIAPFNCRMTLPENYPA